MTKARTKGRKRRERKITLPGGQSVAQRIGQGRRTDLDREPADAVALATRARLTGCAIEDARDPLCGTDMGRCIRAMIPDRREQRDLLDTWQAISASKRNWQQRVTGTNPNPQAAAIAMLPEAMQTNDSHSVDLRTAEERDEAAKRSWMHWLAALMALPAEQRHALRGHIDGYALPIWDVDRLQPTRTGALAVKALSALHGARAG